MVGVAEPGAATRALLAIHRDGLNGSSDLGQAICRACVAGLGVDGAVLSLLTATTSRVTLWATDDIAALIEELQFDLNEGACMEAAETGRPVLVGDLRRSTEAGRWPMFAAAVVEQTPVRALFAFPLQSGTVNLGVLDLYRVRAGNLSSGQYDDALGAVGVAASMIGGSDVDSPLRDRPGGHPDGSAGTGGSWLDDSLSHRAEVHQATGMALVQLGISAPEALAWLRAHAFAHQRQLIDVAKDVVARRLRFTEEMR